MINKNKLGTLEFVSLMALLMSLTALAIDAILPALPTIARDFNVSNANDAQHLISFLFAGLVIGQLLYGPLSDSFGRKRLISVGIVIFLIGCVVSLIAPTFEILLISRLIQGAGIASTRVLTMAMVRDQYVGNEMGKIMSLITMVFIVVPALAPSLGQVILFAGDWHLIIWSFIVTATIGMTWLAIRQPETLAQGERKPFKVKRLYEATKFIVMNRTTMGYTITSGLIFGAFIGYLLSSQQIFATIFDAEKYFPLYFGMLAIFIGCSSFINSRLVQKFGMRRLCFFSLKTITIITLFFNIVVYLFNGVPNLIVFLLFMIGIFMCVGILFGNFNSLAMEEVGHVAGVATAVVTSIQNIVSLFFGSIIGATFNGTVFPIAIGFFILSILALVTMLWTEKFKTRFPVPK